MLRKYPQGASSLESFWEDWAGATNPPLHPSLVIGERQEARDRALAWLRGDPNVLTLQGDSAEEAAAFLAAVVQELDVEEREAILSRAVVVDDATSWPSLALSSAPLMLIARLDQPEGIGRVVQNGHHVFVPLGRTGATGAISLPRLVRATAEQALKEMGLTHERARDLATLARRSVSALRRKLAIAPGIQVPAWAHPSEARVLLAPLLVGAWSDSSEGDRGVLSQLASLPYEDLQHALVRWASEPDPPIRRVGDVWMIAAREDAWRLIARYLTMDHLRRFENVALDVLGECNPALELPPEKRYAASIYGKVLTRSRHAREGIAETLALMATLSSEVEFATGTTGEDRARTIVWKLLERAKADDSVWSSLSSQLPLLAEAAPGVFLDAVDADLAGESPMLVRMFQDQTNETLGGSSPHTGLLWALETLAWNPDHLGRVALSLARLARLDPGGRLANRPAASLRDIFLCWHPNTAVPLQRRLAVLNAIRTREPEVGWRLLVRLLPERHSTVSPTHRTRWRDWVPEPRTEVTVQEYVESTNAILDSLLSDAQISAIRWCDLITSAGDMTMEQRETLLRHLEGLDPGLFASSERTEVRDCLRKEIARHQEFPEADWAMPADHVARLEHVHDRFEPEDPLARYRWLFEQWVEIPGMRYVEWEQRAAVIQNLRAEALREVVRMQGWPGVLNLAEQVKDPVLVGSTLAHPDLLLPDEDAFLRENLATPQPWRSQMARGFVSTCAQKFGEPWINERLAAVPSGTWGPEQYGEFFLCLPFGFALLDRLDATDEAVQQYYWSHTHHVGLPQTPDDAERVLARLLKFDRPHIAVEAISWALYGTPALIASERVAEVLEASMRIAPGPGFNASRFAYDSAKLLSYLEQTDIPRERLSMLELMYLKLHRQYRHPRILHDELTQNPEFFVEVLQHIYRAKNKSQSDEVEDTAIVEAAWDLLYSWKGLPGVQEDGTVDVELLRAWVLRARELATACDRREIADTHIGHVFAFAPPDPDGAWPHQGVRDLIEELESADIENGLWTQVMNNRGVTMRGPTEGGKQERNLASQYDSYGEQLADLWPRTAAILRAITEDYRRQGAQHDRQAELTQDFWR